MPTIQQQFPTQSRTNQNSKPRSVVDRITSISFDESKGISLLIYGRSATGKTSLYATFPGPILAIVCSGPVTNSGEMRTLNSPEYRDKIQTVSLQDSSELADLMKHARSTGKYRTIALDHATGFYYLVLKEILGLKQIPVELTWGMATKQDYSQAILKSREFFRTFLDLPMYRVIVAQEANFGDETGSDIIKPVVGAELSPKLTGWLNPACDYVVQTYLRPKMEVIQQKIGEGKNQKIIEQRVRGKGVEYCIRTEPHEVYMTKFRIPGKRPLPECIVDPSYDKIMALIRGE